MEMEQQSRILRIYGLPACRVSLFSAEEIGSKAVHGSEEW